MLTSPEAIKEIDSLKNERDQYKKKTEEMLKFLSDYGLKWVGGKGGQNEGKFDKKALKDELKF